MTYIQNKTLPVATHSETACYTSLSMVSLTVPLACTWFS